MFFDKILILLEGIFHPGMPHLIGVSGSKRGISVLKEITTDTGVRTQGSKSERWQREMVD